MVAYLAEALQDYGLRTGLPSEHAAILATHLLSGTAALIQTSGKPAKQISQEVQTPGGTTECAIGALVDGGFKSLINSALDAAAKRSKELGQ
ncbi:Pyrroline-5-carboxylate reductase [compost metagenome]